METNKKQNMEKENYISIGGIDYYPDRDECHLIRCPKCNRENYLMNVTAGVCTWCGYNANTDEELKNKFNNRLNEQANKRANAGSIA